MKGKKKLLGDRFKQLSIQNPIKTKVHKAHNKSITWESQEKKS